MNKLMLFALAILGSNAFADLNTCKQAVRENVRNCEESGASTYAADEAQSAQLQAASSVNMRGGAESLNGAASANVQRWGALKSFCEASRRECADNCNNVNESPQANQQAKTEKEKCFTKVNQVIQQAERGVSSNTGYTAQSATSGNQTGMQGAETIEGNVHKTGSGQQGLAFTQNGETKIYGSSNTPGTDNLKVNMRTLQGYSDPGTNVRILLPAPRID